MNLQLDARDRIVVGTDGSRRADHAVDWAAERAEVLDVPLLVLHVVAGSPNPSNAFSAVAANFDGDLLREAHERLARVVERVHQRHPRLDLTGEVVVGNASWVLAEASKQALLVVVGARGQSAPLTVRVLGGVSDQVTAHATGPIAVVPDEALENPRGPVVLGVDESPEARAAMWFAFRAAEARGVQVLAIHAWGDKDSHDIVSRVSALVEGMLADARRVPGRAGRGADRARRPHTNWCTPRRTPAWSWWDRAVSVASPVCCSAPPASGAARCALPGHRHPGLSQPLSDQ